MDLNQDIVPVTLDDAITLVQKGLSPNDMRTLRELTCVDSLDRTLGEQIRNDWTLWDSDSRMRSWFRIKFEINHPDDVSGLILTCVLAEIQDKPDIVGIIQNYVNYTHARWMNSIGKLMP